MFKKSMLITTTLLTCIFPCTATAAAIAENVKGEFDKGYFVFKSDDGNFEWKFDGRIMIDAKNISDYEGEPLISTNTGFRRIRFAVKTKFYKDWAGEFDIDFVKNRVRARDMWVSYDVFENATVKVGNHKPIFSMAEVTTSRWYPLMETASIADFSAPGRRIGATFTYWQPEYFVGVSVFGEGIGANEEKDNIVDEFVAEELISYLEDLTDAIDDGDTLEEFIADEGKFDVGDIEDEVKRFETAQERTGYAARGVYRPYRNQDNTRVIHLGANILRTSPLAEDFDVWRFRGEVHDISFIRGDRLRPTRDVSVDNIQATSLELAARWDKFYFQSEIINNTVSMKEAEFEDFDISGYYAEASYFIFGDGRTYNLFDGEFGAVVPDVGESELEFIVRYDVFDANDPNTLSSRGNLEQFGEIKNITFGLNWYINSNIIVRLNYSMVDTDENARISDADINIAAARLVLLF